MFPTSPQLMPVLARASPGGPGELVVCLPPLTQPLTPNWGTALSPSTIVRGYLMPQHRAGVGAASVDLSLPGDGGSHVPECSLQSKHVGAVSAGVDVTQEEQGPF